MTTTIWTTIGVIAIFFFGVIVSFFAGTLNQEEQNARRYYQRWIGTILILAGIVIKFSPGSNLAVAGTIVGAFAISWLSFFVGVILANKMERDVWDKI